MATGTVYPTSLDSFTNKVDGVDDILSAETNTQSSALEALQAKVGITNSADPTSHEYKINNVILSDPTTTRGDIITRGATALQRLGVGTDGQVLSTDGIDPIWSDPTGGAGDILSTLAGVAEAKKRGSDIVLPYANSLVEAANYNKTEITLYSDYTGGTTTLSLTRKILIETDNPVPIYITDRTTGNYDIVFLKEITGATAGKYTYSLSVSVSNNYTTANSAFVTNTLGDMTNLQIEPDENTTGNALLYPSTLNFSYVRDGAVVKADVELAKRAFSVQYPADLSTFASAQEIIFDDGGADVSGQFKNDNYIACVKLLKEDNSEVVYPYEKLLQHRGGQTDSWYVFQLNGNGSYSSPDVTVEVDKVLDPETGTFGTTLPTFSDQDDWFVFRIGGFLEYLAGAKSLTSFTPAYPKELVVDKDGIALPEGCVAWVDFNNTNNRGLNKGSLGDFTLFGTGDAYGVWQGGQYYNPAGAAGSRYELADVNATVQGTSNTSYVIEAWLIFPNAPAGYDIVVWPTDSANGIALAQDPSNNFRFGSAVSGYYVYVPFANLPQDGKYHHVLGVWDKSLSVNANYMEMWIDGVVWAGTVNNSASASNPTWPVTAGVGIGSSPSSTDRYLQPIGEILLFKDGWVPSITDAKERYNNGRYRQYNGKGYTMKSKIEDVENIEKFGIQDVNSLENDEDYGKTIEFYGAVVPK